MLDRSIIRAALGSTIVDTNFIGLGEKYRGKVRDCYDRGVERILITSDRLSAFDRFITSIPFKGAVLQRLAISGFRGIDHIVRHHVIAEIDPNIIVAHRCNVVPIEIVVRGYLAGSAWRAYARGEAVSGIRFENGLKEFSKLPSPVLTPSTKAPIGEHDEPISAEEVVGRGLVSARLWSEIEEVALALFQAGSERAQERGLILVDTKYEFGLRDNALMVIDEIHTLDCSRFWMASSYEERIRRGDPPEMFDKETIRRWLMDRGYMGEGELPNISDTTRIEIAEHYLNSCELITGEPLELSWQVDPIERMSAALRAASYI